MKISVAIGAVMAALLCINLAADELKTGAQYSGEAAAKIKRLDLAEFDDQVRAGSLLLDVRTAEEYAAGHLDGAKWAPRGKLEFMIANLAPNADTPILVYCRTGGRSALAAYALQQMGYSNVQDLEGGFQGWADSGRSFVNMHGEVRKVVGEGGS